jgi:hypothetical protein
MDLTPLLCIIRVTEWPLFLLLRWLLLAISTVAMIPVIGSIDIPIVLLLLPWRPLVSWFKESSSGLEGLHADVCNCKQIGHHFGLFHGDLLHRLDVANFVVEGMDDFNVLDVRDSIPGTAKTFYIVPEAFIMLLLDGL